MKDKLEPAVGYIRMSTDQQHDSPARQRRDIEALAKRLGYRIIAWYEDHGLAAQRGSLPWARPQPPPVRSPEKTHTKSTEKNPLELPVKTTRRKHGGPKAAEQENLNGFVGTTADQQGNAPSPIRPALPLALISGFLTTGNPGTP